MGYSGNIRVMSPHTHTHIYIYILLYIYIIMTWINQQNGFCLGMGRSVSMPVGGFKYWFGK